MRPLQLQVAKPAQQPEQCRAAIDARPPQYLTRRQTLGAALLLASTSAAAAAAPPAVAAAASLRPEVERLERDYDKYAATYDELDGGAAAEQLGFPQLRQELLSLARGDVLETAVSASLPAPWGPGAPLDTLSTSQAGGMAAVLNSNQFH